ncbi:perilipin-2-like [Cherax quadricarinatus]|uniref:perilipin-2-like n=1 Tax=Cherax quadricarinatus TaxID=27406 RepID=UPI00387E3940
MAHSVSAEDPHNSILARLRKLPIVKDILNTATDVYKKTQGYRGVGLALRVAEGSVLAATVMLPLATPLLRPVGGWRTVDLWACKALDKLQTIAPIVNKPTAEVVGEIKGKVLEFVAGDDVATGSLTGAVAASPSRKRFPLDYNNNNNVAARAQHTVSLLKDYKGGRTAVNFASVLLDKAHGLVDDLLPPTEDDLKQFDGSDGSLAVKTSALALKTSRRFYRIAHNWLYPHVSSAELSLAHIISLAAASVRNWCTVPVKYVPPEDVTITRLSLSLALHTTRHISVTMRGILNVGELLKLPSTSKIAGTLVKVSLGLAHTSKDLFLMFWVYMKVLLSALNISN